MRRLLLLVPLAALLACGPMNRIATRDQRIVDPEYTGFYQVLGEEHLQRRDYRRAWNEFAALGDFGALRRLIETYADDVQAFDRAMFDSMLEEYARAYRRQFGSPDPLAHFRERLHKVARAHLLAASPRRAAIAWDIERSYFRWLLRIEDRREYFAEMQKLHQRLSGAASPEVQRLAERIKSELEQLSTDYHWKTN